MTNAIAHHEYPNGLVLIAEEMPGVQSSAFTMLIPAGSAFEPAERPGAATMLTEWLMRGAGARDSRELLTALDNLGVSHSEGAQTVHANISAATIGKNLIPALELFADVVLRPRLVVEEVEPIRALALQSLQSLEDDPGSKALLELRRRHFPDPWGRPAPGSPEGILQATPEELSTFFQTNFRPNGAILAVAGALDWEVLRESVGQLFGDWQPKPEPVIQERETGPARDHITQETQQIQVVIAYPSVPVRHPDYYLARATTAILGGYTSSRLFTEVREKRGLCYAVSANYDALKDRAAVICYAGTAPDRALQTLEVTLDEIRRLAESGIDLEELNMMRAGLKSSLIMQQESTMARSGALAADWYHLGRVRPLDEVSDALDALTSEAVNAFAATQPLDKMTILTLGSAPLNLSDPS